jgi:hypothetical protein
MADSDGKKSIDERLEAIAMNLELLWHDIEAMKAANEARDKVVDIRMDKIMTAVEKLVTVMESHERRINGLEGGHR